METTWVFNLTTGEERIYSLPPRESVISAYENERGNNNTWEYKNSRAPIVEGQKTIAAGNWCALKEETR